MITPARGVRGRRFIGNVIATLLIATSCSTGPAKDQLTIVVNAPFQKDPFIAKVGLQGAQLAADQINAKGGVNVGGHSYDLAISTMDDDLSPATSLDNYKQAVAKPGTVAILDDGYTVAATFATAQTAGLPVLVYYDGEAGLIDPVERPNVFRIAPPDDAAAGRLASYLASRDFKSVALVHDETAYGLDGEAQLRSALAKSSVAVAADVTAPSDATDYSTEAGQLVATAAPIVIWAQAPVLAAMVKTIRQAAPAQPSCTETCPLLPRMFASPTAEDPVVRTQLAATPLNVEELTYVTSRITAEGGTADWDAFRASYEAKYGDYRVGVVNSKNQPIVEPPDWQMYPDDFVNLVKAALEKSGTTQLSGGKLIDALNSVAVKAANGDTREFQKDNHEGIPDDDIYFATFIDWEFKPVQDDPLSKSLVPIDQI